MLTTTRKQIVEKVIEKNGFIFRVFFAVSNELDGVKAEIIKVIPLGKIEDLSETIALPICQSTSVFDDLLISTFNLAIQSPYVSSLIDINGSKPRAPTLA